MCPECPFCPEKMLEIWRIDRKDGGFGVPIREHHYECPGCGYHALFTEKIDAAVKDKEKIKENLKVLGYL